MITACTGFFSGGKGSFSHPNKEGRRAVYKLLVAQIFQMQIKC